MQHPFTYSKTFIIYYVLVLSGDGSSKSTVFCIWYASQEIHVVLLLKLRSCILASCIRVRIRVDVKMMLPH